MRLAYAFPASAAEFSQDGKLSVLSGDFDTITVATFPATNPQMVLVVKLELQPLECSREHQLRVELIDADGQRLHESITISFRAQPHPDDLHRRVGMGSVIHYQGITFPKPGAYSIHVLVDDLELGVVPLYLIEGPPPGITLGEETTDAEER